MPTYAQTTTYHEDGVGTVRYQFLVCDTYEGLTAPASDVGIFDVESAKQDVDLDTGVFAADELNVTMVASRIENADDADCFNFILTARDPSVKLFCAVVIDPADPIEADDFAFRGVLQAAMSGEDRAWRDGQYGSDPTPLRSWKLRAYSYDTAEVLGAKVVDLVAAITPEWITANVADRLGYFRETGGTYGYREVRFGNLVAFEDLMQELITRAAPAGITINYVPVDSDFYAVPARFHPVILSDRKLRYPMRPRSTTAPPRAWRAHASDRLRLKLGGDATTDGALFVSWSMLTPKDAEKTFSWLAYDTLADLLYALAATVNMYLDVQYLDTTTLTVSFTSRNDLVGAEVFLRDTTQATIDLKPLTTSDKRKKFVGNSFSLLREGYRTYNYDGGFKPSRLIDAAVTDGEQLPLTVSPSTRLLENTGEDAGFKLGEQYGFSLLPHNAIFYDSPTAPKDKATQGFAEYTAVGLHTGMYIKCLGKAEVDDGEVGVEGLDVFLPVAYLQGSASGVDKWIGIEDGGGGNFAGLADFLNAVRNRDQAYFEGEYQLTVPGLACFRSTVMGSDGWRNVRRGSVINLDSVEWVVVGIERQIKARRTIIRLHVVDRYIIPLPVEEAIPAVDDSGRYVEPSSSTTTISFGVKLAAAEIDAYTAVVVRSDEQVEPAKAEAAHFGRFCGIALVHVDIAEEVALQINGRVVFSEDVTLTPGLRVYVRNAPGPGTFNLSQTELPGLTFPEDMFFDIGYADSVHSMVIERAQQAVLQYNP